MMNHIKYNETICIREDLEGCDIENVFGFISSYGGDGCFVLAKMSKSGDNFFVDFPNSVYHPSRPASPSIAKFIKPYSGHGKDGWFDVKLQTPKPFDRIVIFQKNGEMSRGWFSGKQYYQYNDWDMDFTRAVSLSLSPDTVIKELSVEDIVAWRHDPLKKIKYGFGDKNESEK